MSKNGNPTMYTGKPGGLTLVNGDKYTRDRMFDYVWKGFKVKCGFFLNTPHKNDYLKGLYEFRLFFFGFEFGVITWKK